MKYFTFFLLSLVSISGAPLTPGVFPVAIAPANIADGPLRVTQVTNLLANGSITASNFIGLINGISFTNFINKIDSTNGSAYGLILNSPLLKASNNISYVTTKALTSLSLADRATNFLNSADFGTIANGVIDDTAALQAYVNASTNYGGLIKLPRGIIRITSPITNLHNNTVIEGERNPVGYEPSATNGTVILVDGIMNNLFDVSSIQYCVFKDFSINGNSKVTNAIVFSGTTIIRNLEINLCLGAALRGTNYVNSSRITECTLTYNDIGIQISGDIPTIFQVDHCKIRHNRFGLSLSGSIPTIEDCVIEQNTQIGLWMERPALGMYPPSGGYLNRIWFEQNPIDLMHIACTNGCYTDGVIMENCRFGSNVGVTTTNLSLKSVARWIIKNCDFNRPNASATNDLDSSAIDIHFLDCFPVSATTGQTTEILSGLGTTIISHQNNSLQFQPQSSVTGLTPWYQLAFRGLAVDQGKMFDVSTIGRTNLIGRFGPVMDHTGNGGEWVWYTGTFDSPPTEKMRLSRLGSLGIGTNAPSYTLHVVGDASVTNLTVTTLSSNKVNYPNSTGKLVSSTIGISVTNNYIGIGTSATESNALSSASTTIGGPSLNRVANITPYGVGTSNASAGLLFNHSASSVASTGDEAMIVGGNIIESSSAAGYLDFYTRRADVLTKVLRMDNRGFIGIGTDTPVNTLDLTTGGITSGSLQIVGGNGITNLSLTANMPIQTDGNKKEISSAIDLASSQVTGSLSPSRIPTGLGITNNGATISNNIVAGTNIVIVAGASGQLQLNAITSVGTNGGTVTSVAASVPSVFSISGSPIATSGTLAMTYSGTALPVANGGTGATSLGLGLTNNGSTLSNNIVSGTGISIVSGANGQLTVATSGFGNGQSLIIKTADYTLTSADDTVMFTTNAGVTATLPTAIGIQGKVLRIISNNLSGGVKIATTAGQAINTGVPLPYITSDQGCLVVQSDGSNWKVISVFKETML